jgi:hypothetical protein
MKRPQDGPETNCNVFPSDKITVAVCSIQIEDAHMSLGHRSIETLVASTARAMAIC